MISERIKFYADTPKGEKNKLFTWKTTIFDWQACLFRFIARGYYIRSAWFETVNTETGEIKNYRVPIHQVYDNFRDLPAKDKKLYINVQLNGQFKIDPVNEKDPTGKD